jgi:glucose/arabinose dehydrogenase
VPTSPIASDLPLPTSATTAAAPTPAARVGAAHVLVQGLEVPWGVAFLPDGSALVSERVSHRVMRVTSAGAVSSVGTVPGVADDAGEGGLLGLALSPAFASDQLVYAYLTAADDNRVVRMRYANGKLSAPVAVFTGIPKAANHDGGRIAFGPDRLLYVTAGDANQRDRAPDRSYLGGKVLRMTADGRPAPGNPDPASVVYTVGHRNPQGLAWGPDGRLYEAEFGQNQQDEINLLTPGADYGWPTDEGKLGPARPGLTRPLLTWSTGDASPSGLAYAGGSLWLGTLQGERVYRIPVLAGGRLGAPESLFSGVYGRLRTVAVAPDGALWITTSNRDGRGDPSATDDRIIRVPLQ